MRYTLWYWFYRTAFYFKHVLPYDIAITRQLILNFARFTLTGSL
jgi:hypothetical protein